MSVFLVYFFFKESNPWWQVTLEKLLYVESVEITDKTDCCPRDKGTINITVSSNNQTGLDSPCSRSMQYGNNLFYKFQCSPPRRGKFVTVTLIGKNVTLVFCHVVVRTIGKFYGNIRLKDLRYSYSCVTVCLVHCLYSTEKGKPDENLLHLKGENNDLAMNMLL